MQFYKFSGLIRDKKWAEENDESRETFRKNVRKLCARTSNYNSKCSKDGFLFLSTIDGDVASFGAIVMKRDLFYQHYNKFLKYIGLALDDIKAEEITYDNLETVLSTSSHNGYINDDDEIKEKFEIGGLSRVYRHGVDFSENIIDGSSKEEIISFADDNLMQETFLSEIDRIYQGGKNKKAFGHPVFYLIETDNRGVRKQTYRALLDALFANNRIENKRYAFLDLCNDTDVSANALELIYKCCAGGAVITRFSTSDDDEENEYASSERKNILALCECAEKYRNEVLSIICLPRACTKQKDTLFEGLPNTCFVEITEDLAKDDKAKSYLKMLAKQHHIRTDKKLLSSIEPSYGYLSTELRAMFAKWYDVKLRTSVYPQYKELEMNKPALKKERPKGTAYEQLMSMTGLDSAKKVINEALSYYKAQKLFKDKGMVEEKLPMHLCFYGEPGTGKTEVARMVAEIFKDNGILSKGHLVEVTKSDLCGKYVGWTSNMTQKKCKEAIGGVLFVDECYQLLEKNGGSFGTEATTVLLQFLENNRKDFIVIFAGYKDEVDEFLESNSGLASRIAFKVPFENYSAEEMVSIAEYIAKQKGLHFAKDAYSKLEDIFEKEIGNSDFGNARGVRNLVDHARMAQANRLLLKDLDDISREDIATIFAEDIEAPQHVSKKPEHRKIGFCA